MLPSEYVRIFIADPDLIRQMLNAVAHEALGVIQPMIQEDNGVLAKLLRFADRSPLEIRLPAGSEKTPVAGRNRLPHGKELHRSQAPLEHGQRGTFEDHATLELILDDVAGQNLRA